MKRTLMLLAAGFAALTLAACGSAPSLTFPQQVSIACGAAKAEIVILKSDGVFTGGAAETLAQTIEPAVAKVCSAGASVAVADLQSIVNATLPLVKSMVDASSLSPDKIKAADAAIDTGILAFNLAIGLAPATSADTSAPAAASTPLAGAPLQ